MYQPRWMYILFFNGRYFSFGSRRGLVSGVLRPAYRSICITAMISDLHLFLQHSRDEDDLLLGKVSCFQSERQVLGWIAFVR